MPPKGPECRHGTRTPKRQRHLYLVSRISAYIKGSSRYICCHMVQMTVESMLVCTCSYPPLGLYKKLRGVYTGFMFHRRMLSRRSLSFHWPILGKVPQSASVQFSSLDTRGVHSYGCKEWSKSESWHFAPIFRSLHFSGYEVFSSSEVFTSILCSHSQDTTISHILGEFTQTTRPEERSPSIHLGDRSLPPGLGRARAVSESDDAGARA